MDKVYIVTSGEYSAYGIRAVFSTQELADNYVRDYNKVNRYDLADVEEWGLDREEEKQAVYVYYCDLLLEDGSVQEEWKYCDLRVPFVRNDANRRDKSVRAFSLPLDVITGASTESPEMARKLAVEFRQAHLRKVTEVSNAE